MDKIKKLEEAIEIIDSLLVIDDWRTRDERNQATALIEAVIKELKE